MLVSSFPTIVNVLLRNGENITSDFLIGIALLMSFPLKNHGWTRIDTDLNHPCSSVFICGLFSNYEIFDIIFDSFLSEILTTKI